uniref:Putative amino acid transporter n=1 Tax=Solibacter usitatus (strain Ellin6076) TaxID=234267 RepID=Q027M6_SOLUE
MKFSEWLLADLRVPEGIQSPAHPVHPWWRVMCLTGVDYFSTLGYQPGIAYLAAGLLSPLATLILVLVTLFGALPVYSRVAAASPNGQGSIGMLERLFPKWSGKVFVLILLGFATTDFVITMTLSAADAAAHVVQNPFVPDWMRSQMGITLILLAILGSIFMMGFKEAIGVAVILVALYLSLNLVVTAIALRRIFTHPELIPHWKSALFATHGSPWTMLGISLLLFPKLALGLSGFETGVAVMPLVKAEDLAARIRNTRKLLFTAAAIMSVFLMATSFATALLIEPEKFREGGEANGRALAYLAHRYGGGAFGSLYDVSTILILAFAGASAMAGLLNLIPRYLPRFGMAPEWARASRPLVLVFMAVAFAVTLLFRASVDAQGGAYATGVLVLITSGATAVTLSVWNSRARWPFLAIAVIFVYTTAMNIHERPEGIKIASFFIGSMILTSLISRALRSTELRICAVEFDHAARALLAADEDQLIRVIARRPRPAESEQLLDEADRAMRFNHCLEPNDQLYFLEVERGDASEFTDTLRVTGERVGAHAVLRASSPVVANAIAALLIELERTTGKLPHAYFSWTEGNPVINLIRFLILGEGDVAPICHEVLRRAVPDPAHRPIIHVT